MGQNQVSFIYYREVSCIQRCSHTFVGERGRWRWKKLVHNRLVKPGEILTLLCSRDVSTETFETKNKTGYIVRKWRWYQHWEWKVSRFQERDWTSTDTVPIPCWSDTPPGPRGQRWVSRGSSEGTIEHKLWREEKRERNERGTSER